jgi:TolB protein
MTVKPHAVARLLNALLVLFTLCWLMPAAQALDVNVSGGKINPMPIAIAPFMASGGAEDTAATISGVIANDLTHSGYFNALPPNSFIEQISDFNATPRFADWRQIMAKALVTGQTYADSGGRVRVEFKLFDVNSGQLLAGQQFTASKANVRRVAHRIADMVYKALLGIDGYFDTRIVYVSESGPKDNRAKKLAIMDQDGFNPRVLLDTGEIILTPRFSPSSQEITFMAIGKDEPRVYIYNVDTRQREIVGSFPNMSFAPRFSPDGQRVIMSLQSDDGQNANVFEMDLRSRQMRQLTNEASINTAPSYAPDGGRITFESDRSGSQQVYVMNADGSGQKRISFGKGRYSTPVWSPDGQYIAFTKQAEGRFAIGVMKPDGSGERILTEGYHNEGPTWAPNGRVLMFFRDSQGDGGGPQLWSVDITGYNEQQVQTDGFASDPSWSPRLN